MMLKIISKKKKSETELKNGLAYTVVNLYKLAAFRTVDCQGPPPIMWWWVFLYVLKCQFQCLWIFQIEGIKEPQKNGNSICNGRQLAQNLLSLQYDANVFGYSLGI